MLLPEETDSYEIVFINELWVSGLVSNDRMVMKVMSLTLPRQTQTLPLIGGQHPALVLEKGTLFTSLSVQQHSPLRPNITDIHTGVHHRRTGDAGRGIPNMR